GLEVEVWDEHRLAAEGFGGVLAVAAGSAAPPRFVRVEHRPAGTEDDPPVVLVGKGITFDTGGLAVKPREGMVPMKTDMSGAAALGLGRRHAALYSTDDALAAQLVEAAAASGERAWRMPLVEDYRAAVDSDVADVRQAVTEPGYGAGSITAALFLREFTDGRP